MVKITELKDILQIAFQHNGWKFEERISIDDCWQLEFQKEIGSRKIVVRADAIEERFFLVRAEEIIWEPIK